MRRPRRPRLSLQIGFLPFLCLASALSTQGFRDAEASAKFPSFGYSVELPYLIPAGDRYTGRSGGSRYAVPSARSGLSDTYVDGGYGFTRKSFFKNSENNKSHFRNSFSKRSYFGHRYDRISKLHFGLGGPDSLVRPLTAPPKLKVWQPTGVTSLAWPNERALSIPSPGNATPRLSAREIEVLVSGRSATLEILDVGKLEGRFASDGSAAYRNEDGRRSGSWRAEDSRLCLTVTRSTPARCYGVATNGPVMLLFMASGAPAGRALFTDAPATATAPHDTE